jgi:hypothetical protein
MKKFLYLRINAIAGIIASIISFWYTIATGQQALKSDFFFFLIFFLLIYGIPFFHNLFITFIYRKYYPEREIPRLNRVLNVILCVLCVLDMLAFIALTYSLTDYTVSKNDPMDPSIMISLFVTLSITTSLQIIGSFRLIKVVRDNVRLQLESSFV